MELLYNGVKHTHYYLVNVISTLNNAIDESNSNIKWTSTSVPFSKNSATHFRPLQFHSGCMGHTHIARLHEDMRKIFISNKLANALFKFEKLAGIKRDTYFNECLFRPLYEMNKGFSSYQAASRHLPNNKSE
ncbi:MAG: hypothetical protein HRT90_07690 [Candidatus Margulisbacteria bacterium]|nr:hypothetical protein [Candidatus Margulisiibacteriota bacterium]